MNRHPVQMKNIFALEPRKRCNEFMRIIKRLGCFSMITIYSSVPLVFDREILHGNTASTFHFAFLLFRLQSKTICLWCFTNINISFTSLRWNGEEKIFYYAFCYQTKVLKRFALRTNRNVLNKIYGDETFKEDIFFPSTGLLTRTYTRVHTYIHTHRHKTYS